MSRPRLRTLLATLPRLGLVRLVVIGFPLMVGLGLVLAFHFEYGRKELAPSLDFVATVVLTLVLALVYTLLVRMLEGRWPRELAVRPGARELVVGVAIGAALFGTVYAIFAVLGAVRWEGFNGFDGVASTLLIAIVAAVGEELLFRGVLFRLLEESFGTLAALVLSAAAFGLLHASNPGATAWSSIAVGLEAGVMLAAAYAWTRNLWLPIGLHLGWNFTEGGVFGAAVSGERGDAMLSVPLSGSASPLITGGAFGPEASVVAVAICLLAGAAFLLAAKRAGHWRPPSFRTVLDRGRARARGSVSAGGR